MTISAQCGDPCAGRIIHGRMRELAMSLTFDVGTVLGIGRKSDAPLPELAPGTIVIRIPDGISPLSLRESDVGKTLIRQDDTWYDTYDWATSSPITAGPYRLRLPILDSNSKTFDEQKALLLPGEQVAPLVLVELALLCVKNAGLSDPLKGGWVRCAETTAGGGVRVVLRWDGGRLSVDYYWGDSPHDLLWLSSVRTS